MRVTVPLTLEVDLDIGLAYSLKEEWLIADIRAAVLDHVLEDESKYKLMTKIRELTEWSVIDIEQGE